MKNHHLVALLPMKAHSARVIGKNFRTFAGKPLFRWIFDTLLSLPEIELIVINTDAREILASHGVAESDRVLIRDRKPELCGDFTSMNLVLADDVASIPSRHYLMTHTTNPLLSGETIRAAWQTYEARRAAGTGDSLFTVNRYQSRFYTPEGKAINHDPKNLIRTQDLEPMYEENSNLYIFTGESFTATKARIGSSPVLFETPRSESFDIDDQVGWEIAEMIAEAVTHRSKPCAF